MQAETKRIYSIMYSERHENRATVKAGELVKAGAIGRVIQTIGVGPHRLNGARPGRPGSVKEQYGGILVDIASHQFDQFLFFTGSTKAEVVASQVGNLHHPDHPGLEDFGDVMLRGNGGPATSASTGSRRRASPPGATAASPSSAPTASSRSARTSTWPAAARQPPASCRPEGDPVHRLQGRTAPLRRARGGRRLNRTETAMPQQHCFLAMELALKAEASAQRIGPFARAVVRSPTVRRIPDRRRGAADRRQAAASLHGEPGSDAGRRTRRRPRHAGRGHASVSPDAVVRARRRRSGSRRCPSATDASARWSSATSASSACRSTTTRCGRAGRAAGTPRAPRLPSPRCGAWRWPATTRPPTRPRTG